MSPHPVLRVFEVVRRVGVREHGLRVVAGVEYLGGLSIPDILPR